MRRDERDPRQAGSGARASSSGQPRSGSAPRRQSSVPRRRDPIDVAPGSVGRPPSGARISSSASPPTDAHGYVRGSPGQSHGAPYAVPNVADTSRSSAPRCVRSPAPPVALGAGPLRAAATAATGQRASSVERSSVARVQASERTGQRAGSVERRNSARGHATDVAPSAMSAYLKVHGLQQYARAFTEHGLGDLDVAARLSETETLEFLEQLRIYPGHRLRLVRATDCLRNAALGAERRDVAQMIEDDAALDRLCAQNEVLSKVKETTEEELRRFADENGRLLDAVRQQDAALQKSRNRISELEELVRRQTEQVAFLTQQLQQVAKDPKAESDLYRTYREHPFRDRGDADDDWSQDQRIPINLPDASALGNKNVAMKAHAVACAEVSEVLNQSRLDFTPPRAAPASAPLAGASRSHAGGARTLHPGSGGQANSLSAPGRARMAQSLDSAQIKESIAGFDVDHIIRCLAMALENKIILTVSKSRPHSATPAVLAACSIYLEPACLERLQQMHQAAALNGSAALRDTLGKPVDPLNNVAVRIVPNTLDIYGFLRDVMVNFRLEPEVSVVTLFYMERFIESSGVALTPDNWQRLTISAMMLASKVWNDESFENAEFVQLCPLYSIEEINAFERVFLKSVSYNMSVKGSEYAKTYFLLRTLGAKDCPEFGLAPMDDLRASRLTERCLEKQVEFKNRYADAEGSPLNWTL